MNRSPFEVVLVPAEVVTVTSTVPVPAGEVASQVVTEAHDTPVAAVDPKSTVVAPEVVEKPVPVIVTVVPPVAGPVVGSTPVTVGAGGVPL